MAAEAAALPRVGWGHLGKVMGAATVLIGALLIGIAAAFFVKDQAFGGNAVTGGTLTVSAEGLPLDFGGDKVFPTTAQNPAFTVDDQFTVKNANDVPVSYLATARCTSCAGAGGDPSKQQFDSLYIRITPHTEASGAPSPIGPSPVYQGKLADLNGKPLVSLDPDESQLFDVKLWLADTNVAQPQGITTVWDIVLSARTPVPTTTSPIPVP